MKIDPSDDRQSGTSGECCVPCCTSRWNAGSRLVDRHDTK
jgi:hypothetical protein